MEPSPPTALSPHPRRRRALLAVSVGLFLLAGAWAAWQWLVAGRHESTDNAYVHAHLVQVTPQAAGTVKAVLADETDMVRAGQPLVEFDAADARLALARAEAQLAEAVRRVRSLYAGNAALAAQVALRQAEAARARGEMARAQQDMERRAALVEAGAVSREELHHARAAHDNARSALAAAEAAVLAAREELAGNRTQTDGTTLADHPGVRLAAANMKEAWIALRRASLRAPVDGQVARRTVQLGQQVTAGTALMALVALDQVWVEANFKEGQLRRIRIGQPVKLTADVYGSNVEYAGRVVGLGAGTGAAFALLPAQNATGNWIKVVQRVPVRIALDPAQVRAHPLRVGLSVQVTVDVRDQRGAPLGATRSQPAMSTTPVFDDLEAGAEEAVQRVIAAHAGRARAASD